MWQLSMRWENKKIDHTKSGEQIQFVTIKGRIETVEGNTTAGRLLGVLKLVKKKNDYK